MSIKLLMMGRKRAQRIRAVLLLTIAVVFDIIVYIWSTHHA